MKLLSNDDIMLDESRYEGTPGWYELIFSGEPPAETSQKDLDVYKKLLTTAGTHLKSNGVIKSSSSQKYWKMIKPLF